MPESLWQDLRFGARLLLRAPGFTAAAIVSLALGIGANAAIFTVVNGVLLRPLRYRDPNRLVLVWQKSPRGARSFSSAPNFLDWQRQNQVFEQMAAIHGQSFSLTGAEKPERVLGAEVSAAFFPLLGVEPSLGRLFSAREDRPGGDRVVLLSHGLWQRNFGGDPRLLGQTLTLNSQSFTVIGILPPEFEFLTRQFELWIPLALEPNSLNRAVYNLRVVARLRPGLALRQAQADLDTIARRLEADYPDANRGWGVIVEPLRERLVGDVRPALLVLLGAVAFVLLIACASVANLLLARAGARQREMAVRAALGASRARLVRQLLTEGMLLALAGGALGLALASWGTRLLVALNPSNLPRLEEVTIDARVLGFSLGVAVLTGLLFGLAPALSAVGVNLNESLKRGGRTATAGGPHGALRGRGRSLLVASETALALLMLIGAGLMLKSFVNLLRTDLGFRPDNVLSFQLALPAAKYREPPQIGAFYEQLLRRVESLPGVESAAAVTNLPVGGIFVWMPFTVEGRLPASAAERPTATFEIVSPGYWRAMGIPLVRGRYFTERDSQQAPPVAIISQSAARRFWPGPGGAPDPIGRRILVETLLPPQGAHGPPVSREIVGVVGDVRRFGLGERSATEIYVPYRQNPFPFAFVVVRARSDAGKLAGEVRAEVQALDRDLPVADLRTMEARLDDAIAQPRLNTLLLGVFAALALILAAVGVYSVMAYVVGQRTHDIGLRIALGAEPSDVLKLILGQGLVLTLLGVAIGLAAAFAQTRLLAGLLYGVSPTDPAVFAGVALLLAAVALVACYLPARRASRLDPMAALRHE